MAEQLRTTFTRLSGGPEEPTCLPPPASFQFRWGGEGEGEVGDRGDRGEERGWDGPSLSHQTLDAVVTDATPINKAYWHPALKICSWYYDSQHALLPAAAAKTHSHTLLSVSLSVSLSYSHLPALSLSRPPFLSRTLSFPLVPSLSHSHLDTSVCSVCSVCRPTPFFTMFLSHNDVNVTLST